MASFEPFVSSDPFSMSTFNSKLGGAFGKVDVALEAMTDPLGLLKYAGKITKIYVYSQTLQSSIDYLEILNFGQSGDSLSKVQEIIIKVNSIDSFLLQNRLIFYYSMEFSSGKVETADGPELISTAPIDCKAISGRVCEYKQGSIFGNNDRIGYRWVIPWDYSTNQNWIFYVNNGQNVRNLKIALGTKASVDKIVNCDIDVYVKIAK